MSTVTGGPVVTIPTAFGPFTAQAWTDAGTGVEHLTMSAPGTGSGEGSPLVRMHSECLTGDVFGSYRCDCGEQLEQALESYTGTLLLVTQGGTVVYLRGQEGRGIGLANKLRAYALQENGADTVEANEQLGLPVDARDYLAAADILSELGVTRIRLLSNNPVKREHLERYGITVVSMVPSEIPSRLENQHYLETKRDRLNHQLSHLEERFHQRPQEKIVQQS